VHGRAPSVDPDGRRHALRGAGHRRGARARGAAPAAHARAGHRRLGGAALRPLARGGDGHAGAAHRARPRASRRVPGGRAGPPVRPHRSAGGGPAPSGARAPPAASRGDRRAVLGDAAAAASPASPACPPTSPTARHPRPRPGGRLSRRRSGRRRPPLARLPVIGRWSALAEEEGLSPEEREEARAHLLLARYGVLSRELAQGDWSTLRHTLLRMEYGGEVVRGYFVEGLSGEQYALEDTLRELETPSRRAEPHVLVTIADPANLSGRVFTLTRRDGQRASAARIPTTWLIVRQ